MVLLGRYNGLLDDGTLIHHLIKCGLVINVVFFHIEMISEQMLKMPVFKLVLKVPYSRLQPYPPEDNELTNWGRMTHICVILHLEAAVYLARTNCIIESEDISLRPGTYRTFWLGCTPRLIKYNDVMKSKLFPRYWPFVQGIHRSPVNSPHKGQWRGALIFSLIWVWINEWVNNREGIWYAIALIMTCM